MFAVMMLGMFVAAFIFAKVVGLTSWEQAVTQYPSASLIVMAAGMTIPMTGWMLYRGMGWPRSAQMAAAMGLPVLPFLCLVWFDVTQSAACSAYCAVSVLAMLALMASQGRYYSMDHEAMRRT